MCRGDVFMIRILVIDDSIIIYKMIKRAAEPNGWEVVDYAKNGKEGLEMIKQHNPDVIILDLTMPIMDGFETAIEISKNTPALFSKIIVLSSMGDEKLLRKLDDIGIKYHIKKPVKADEFEQKVRAIMR
jgi:two-component system chemotaxis response regulator CheY